MNAWLECRLWCAGWSKALMKVWWTCQRPIFLQPHHPSCVILAAVYLDIDTINKIWCSPQKEIISYQNDNFINWLGAQSNTSLHLVKRVTNFGPLPHFMDNLRSYRFFPVMWGGWIRIWWRCINEFTSISKLAGIQGPTAHQEGSVNCLRMKMMKIIMSLHTILVGQWNQKTSQTR